MRVVILIVSGHEARQHPGIGCEKIAADQRQANSRDRIAPEVTQRNDMSMTAPTSTTSLALGIIDLPHNRDVEEDLAGAQWRHVLQTDISGDLLEFRDQDGVDLTLR